MRKAFIPSIIFLIISLLYIALPIQALSFQHDALMYLAQTKSILEGTSSSIYHPHHFLSHVLFETVAKGIMSINSWLPIQDSIIAAFRYTNIFFSLATLCIGLYILKVQLNGNWYQQTWFLLALSLSMLPWSYASSTEIYQPCVSFFLLTIAAMFSPPSHKQRALLILACIISISLHMMAIILIPGVLFYHFRKNCFLRGLLSVVIIGLGLLLVYSTKLQEFSSIIEMIDWISPGKGHSETSLATMVTHTIIGFGRSVFGALFLFSYEPFATLMSERLFPLQYFSDERYMVRNMSSPTFYFLSFLGIYLASLFISLIAKTYENERFKSAKAQTFTIIFFSGVFLAIYNRDAYNTDMYALIITIFWLALAAHITKGPRETFFVIGLGLFNFFGSILFLLSPSNDLYLDTTHQIQQLPTDRSIIVDLKRNYAPYFIFYNITHDISYRSHSPQYEKSHYVIRYGSTSESYFQRRHPHAATIETVFFMSHTLIPMNDDGHSILFKISPKQI